MSQPFAHRFRVRYSEVDPQAVVFNSRYLEYADLVVTEWFRALGIGFAGEQPMEFHVARAVVDYRSPLRADQQVEGRLRVVRLGNSSMTVGIALHLLDEHGSPASQPSAEIELVQVHVDLDSGASQPLPDRLRARLTGETVHG